MQLLVSASGQHVYLSLHRLVAHPAEALRLEVLIATARFDSAGGHMDGQGNTYPLYLTPDEMRVVFMSCNRMVEGARRLLLDLQVPPSPTARDKVHEDIRLAEGITAAIAETNLVAGVPEQWAKREADV